MSVRPGRTSTLTRRGGVAALMLGAAPASAAPGDASAHSGKPALSLLGGKAASAGPFAAADTNEPATDTFVSVELPSLLKTGAIDTSASRDDRTGGVHAKGSTGDVVLSSATCGPAGLPIPLASGAGLWLSLGLLAVSAVPLGVVAIRRHRSASPLAC